MSGKSYWLRLAGGLGVLAVLIGLWFGDEYYTEREEKEKEQSSKALVFESEKLLRIRLEAGTTPIEMERSGAAADWVMVQPYSGIEADQDAVRNFVTALGELRREREFEGVDVSKLAEFGLDKPRRVVVLSFEGGTETRLEIGGDVQIGKQQGASFQALSVYGKVTSGDADLIMMPSSVLTSTEKTFGDFRTKLVAKFIRENVSAFQYLSNDGEIQAKKGEDGKWTVSLSNGKSFSGDSNAIGLYLDKLQRLKADSVTEKSGVDGGLLASFGLEPPSRTVTLSDAQGQVLQILALGVNSTQTSAIMADGGIARLSLETYAELTPEIKSLRDLRVMAGLDFSKVKRLKTNKGKIFEKEGQKWYPVAADGGAKVESRDQQNSRAEVATLASDFEFMRAKDIIDPDQVQEARVYGFEKPISTFSFEFEEGVTPSSVEVTLGSRVAGDETSIHLKHNQSGAVFKVETSWMNALEALDSDEPQASGNLNEVDGLAPQATKDNQDSK